MVDELELTPIFDKEPKKEIVALTTISIVFTIGAEGRTRTGTLLGRLILSQVRLPIPPLRQA